MDSPQATSYDELPYGDNCFPDTHPDALAALAWVYGIEAPPPDHCRVLELGCAAGGNLIAMALESPGSTFVGVDLSARQVAAGRAVVDALGLRNIELKAMSLADVDADAGPFDYVVCHGVYSWVPAPVRARILGICDELLVPNGLAYVSYNTYPGWHGRGLVRELLAYHVRRAETAEGRVESARGFLDEVVRVLPEKSSAYARILRTEGEFLRGVANSYLYHEHLEETNHPLYFHEFVAQARENGLRFLAESRTPGLIDTLPPDAREALDRWADGGDDVEAEQYLDFLCNRTFRRSVLCRAGLTPTRPPDPSRVAALSVTTNLSAASDEPDTQSDAPEPFRTPEGASGLTTNNPVVKTALVALQRAWPRAIAFESLLAGVEQELAGNRPDVRETLQAAVLRCALADLVQLHVRPPRFASEPGERPLASPLARLQAADGGRVTNLRRRTVELPDFDRLVIAALDGTRDRPALLETLAGRVDAGDFTVYDGDDPVTDRGTIADVLAGELGPSLLRLAGMALLVR